MRALGMALRCALLAAALVGCASGARKAPEAPAAVATASATGAMAKQSAGRPEGAPGDGKVAIWLTTGDQSRLFARQPDIALGAAPPPRTPWSQGVETAGPLPAPPHTIDIDPASRHQKMVGFGAALSEASAWVLRQRLTPEQRGALLAELFGRERGIGLSFARLYLGSSEFARSQYSYNDLPAGEEDPGLTQFSVDADRALVLPLAQDALALNPDLELVASPASAPGWMKSGGALVKGTLRPEAYGAYARYLKRYVDVLLEEGVPIYALTVQNEPHAEPEGAPGMRLDAAARAQLIGKHLGPLLEDDGPRILEWDGNWDEPQSPLKVLADKAAGPYVAGVAWHCYGGEVGAQGAVRDARPEKEVYVTECSGGQWAPGWSDNLLHFSRTLMVGAARNWAKGVVLGNLAQDGLGGPRTGGCRGCRGVVTVTEDGAVVRNAEYYALAHASRSVLPGAWRVASSAGRDGVDNAAFENPDGTLALLVVNSAQEPRRFQVRAAGRGYGYTLPAASVATFTWRP
ncbi:glycoside hydrolase family 30 protein [Pseudoduganella namucuonensis]|nr:glycoside hydrolase family 30 beta sandwich domain-containing protein [Pseudoduganella namucuonensis]